MRVLRASAEILMLFAAGLGLGLALQAAGFWPGRAALIDAAPAFAPVPPDPVTTSALPAPTIRIVPLEGDGDPVRDQLRRAVILTARAALADPCNDDRRAALAVTVRDYARAWGQAPRTNGARAGFTTPLDDEAVRAIATARQAGVFLPRVAERWPSSDGAGLADILRRDPRSTAAAAEACPGPRTGGNSARL